MVSDLLLALLGSRGVADCLGILFDLEERVVIEDDSPTSIG